MSDETDDPRSPLRRYIYGLLILTSAVVMTARIFHVQSFSGQTPFLGANDRSRWSTIRALVDHGTYAIDDVIFNEQGKKDRDWYTIDMVRHQDRDGHEHYYSSKPPLLATLLAGEYWLLQRLTGATLAEHPFYVAQMMLILSNVLPLVGGLFLFSRLVENLGSTDWGRVLTMTAATWGTFATAMSVTLNNHIPAIISVIVTCYALSRLWREAAPGWCWFALTGLAGSFAVANEMPALSFFACVVLAAFWKSPKWTMLGLLPPALLVLAGSLGTNYVAHGTFSPAYAFRHGGATVGRVPALIEKELPTDTASAGEPFRQACTTAGFTVPENATLTASVDPGYWTLLDVDVGTRWAVVRKGSQLEVRVDPWYDYAGSYWTSVEKRGVDRGEPSRGTYLFHIVFGHHGLFSLTPLWLLSVIGLVILFLRRDAVPARLFALAATAIIVVCLAFYISRPLADRNYGGVCCGFRWLFWVEPLWLIALLPAADAIGQLRIGRILGAGLLSLNIFSVTYPLLNPWSQPWLFEYWTGLGWIRY